MSKKAVSKSEKPPVRKIGYARVSTADQNLDMQIQALKDYGAPKERATRGVMAPVGTVRQAALSRPG